MSDLGGRSGRERWASDHERARQRAAERLSLPLPTAENTWVDRHLANCLSCAAIAAAYAEEQAALRALPEALPPRDMWARTAAALDRAERQAPRDLPNPSVFPGRGGRPMSRGSRSIRGLRAERRASAFRSSRRGLPPRLLVDRPGRARGTGLAWLAPFGALAAMALVIVVGGTAFLTNSGAPGLGPIHTTNPTLAAAVPTSPVATPLAVGAGEVAWLTPTESGAYRLTFSQVDQVCPATAAPDCAPIASGDARQLPAVNAVPHTVLRNPAKSQLVVVTSSVKGRGASLIVVAVPTPVPSEGTASATAAAATDSPTASPSAEPTGTASPAATEQSSPTPSTTGASPSETVTASAESPANASPTEATPTSSDAQASAGGTGQPTGGPTTEPTLASESPAATESNAPSGSPVEPSATVAPGSSASASPDGSPAVASESPTNDASSPSDASESPTPTATALAIISDVVIVGETAAYSPDGTMLAFTARPADDSHGPDIYLWRVGEGAARPVTTDHASVFSGWLGGRILGSRAVDAAGLPASGASNGTGLPTSSDGAATPEPTAAASDGSAPSAGAASPSDPASAAPSGDTGSTGVSALAAGRASVSLLSVDRTNAEGAATLALTLAPAADPSADPSASASPTDPATGPASSAGGALARSFILDPQSLSEVELTGPAWRPVVDPSGRFVVYWAGSLRYDTATLTWQPSEGLLVIASWPALAGTDAGAKLSPAPLLDTSVDGTPSGELDIRWDESGTHLGVWLADPGDPNVGWLSLLTIDPSNGRVDRDGIALHGVAALAGFSIGGDRLAWATPPGQDGEGSRIQVLAWSGANAGKIDSQPASGNDAVIVVR